MSSTTEAYPTVFTESMTGIGTWTAPDAWASEKELGEFMAGLIRLLKPTRVLETGCYNGDTTMAMLRALLATHSNKKWFQLVTCDTDTHRRLATDRAVDELDKRGKQRGILWDVAVDQCTGEHLCSETENVDLAFLDSSGDRVAEAKALHLSPRGIVVLHDARRDTLKRIVDELGWQYVFVSTPRGTAILQPQRDFHALP